MEPEKSLERAEITGGVCGVTAESSSSREANCCETIGASDWLRRKPEIEKCWWGIGWWVMHLLRNYCDADSEDGSSFNLLHNYLDRKTKQN